MKSIGRAGSNFLTGQQPLSTRRRGLTQSCLSGCNCAKKSAQKRHCRNCSSPALRCCSFMAELVVASVSQSGPGWRNLPVRNSQSWSPLTSTVRKPLARYVRLAVSFLCPLFSCGLMGSDSLSSPGCSPSAMCERRWSALLAFDLTPGPKNRMKTGMDCSSPDL